MTYIRLTKKLQNYVHNVDTSFTSQTITATSKSNNTSFNSSEVVYTPVNNALNVVYEISFQIAPSPDYYSSLMSFRLEYSDDDGSTWTDLTGTQALIGSSQQTNPAESAWHIYTFKVILDAWTGERKIRANGPCWASSTQYTLGRSFNASDSTGVGSCPHVSIYSIM